MNKTGIESVDQIINLVDELNLSFEVLKHDYPLNGFKLIRIKSTDEEFECLVDDEYSDVRTDNPWSSLQAVLFSALDLEDEEGEISKLKSNYKKEMSELERFVNLLKKKIDPNTFGVEPMKWQLNSEDAFVLRNLKNVGE
ncbi:MAG: hypothetical protein EP326_08630 [Deltaproteobacteria bacterium]|nr:MAG: hypothetical protein EP326_08630 [Deltaproteobacteria bacterium]